MTEWTRRDVLKVGIAASFGLSGGMARLIPPRSFPSPRVAGRERLLLDFGWRFHLGHADDPSRDFGFGTDRQFAKVGEFFDPSRIDFDVGGWSSVDLPHDWAVELPFENAPNLTAHGSKPLGRAYPATSIGWYRRSFTIPAEDLGRRITVEFDGVFRDALVALNGHFLGRNQSGYAPFSHDVTDLVNFGGANTLVLRVDASENEGWFYEGAGIYRHVWLVKTHPVHVPQWGTYLTSEVASRHAVVTLHTEVCNDSDRPQSISVATAIWDDAADRRAGIATPATILLQPWTRRTVTQLITVPAPRLWSIESPHLYRAESRVSAGGIEVDRYQTTFGIRSIHFDPDQGFFLNGKRVELKGTCNHQDHAGVGTAVPDRIHVFRVESLKAMGSNAWRTAHNPPAPELLDACDRLGMLVLDETRMFSSNEEGLGQLERMIRRDRNHPSVFCWSIGNEEWAVQGNETGARIGESMRRLAHQLDPSRPVTAGMDSGYSAGLGLTLAVDVQGFNYQREDQDAFHRNFPTRPTMGTETASAYSTRGIYQADKNRGYVSAYDVNRPGYGATAEQWWTFYAARKFLAGGFVWTGFDYRGEPSPYEWPCISSHFGILDTCGFPKDTFHYYRTWWGNDPSLYLFPHWNWSGSEGEDIDVWCYSNLERVELLLNDRSLGVQAVVSNSHLRWAVPYAPGVLVARGYRGDRLVATVQRETAGAAAGIEASEFRLSPLMGDFNIAADGEDIAIIEVRIVDADRRLVPTADHQVSFRVTGPGRLIGVGNGDPSSHESDKGNTRKAFNGLCLALVQSTKEPGTIILELTAPGLEATTVEIRSRPASRRPAVD
jgi:beta-galactosidase